MPGRRAVPQPSDLRSRECSNRRPPRFLVLAPLRPLLQAAETQTPKTRLTSRFAWLRPPPFIRIRQTAWPGTLRGTFLSRLLRADETGNKADNAGRLGMPSLCHARIS